MTVASLVADAGQHAASSARLPCPVAGGLALLEAGRFLTEPGSHPGLGAGNAGGVTTGLYHHPGMKCVPGTRCNDAGRHRRRVSRMARFQQTLRRLAMGDEAFVQDEAGFGFDRDRAER